MASILSLGLLVVGGLSVYTYNSSDNIASAATGWTRIVTKKKRIFPDKVSGTITVDACKILTKNSTPGRIYRIRVKTTLNDYSIPAKIKSKPNQLYLYAYGTDYGRAVYEFGNSKKPLKKGMTVTATSSKTFKMDNGLHISSALYNDAWYHKSPFRYNVSTGYGKSIKYLATCK